MAALPYEVIHSIGRQGAVETLAARDASGAPVFVKRLGADGTARDPTAARRFRREMTISASLRHPAIADCVAAGDDWLAFEWLETSLDRPERQEATRDPATLRATMAQVADGLAYVHGRGIVHGDLKPDHIRFRGEKPVLVDFGIASLGNEDPLRDLEFAGSPRWMAPEILDGHHLHPAADVWSLCAIAAWLLGGAPRLSIGADAVLERRRTGLSEAWLENVPPCSDPRLRELIVSGLGAPEGRPIASAVAQLMTRSTDG